MEQARREGFRVPPPSKVSVPLIDVHTHAFPDRPSHELAEAARLYGVERVVALASLEQSVGVRDGFPDLFLPGPMLDYSHWQDPERFAATNVEVVRRAAREGAPLIKLWFAPRFRDRVAMALDDPRLDPIFDEIGRQGLAVLVHVSDPDLWFQKYYADAARYGTKADQYPPLERRLESHPGIVFISAHMGGDPEHLDHLADLMERYPNYNVDTSATKWVVRELGRKPAEARDFFQAHADRVLFGTDQVVYRAEDAEPDRYRVRYWVHRVFWETGIRAHSPIPDADAEGEPELNGLDLPPHVLEKVYQGNARRLLALTPPVHRVW
ncbi:amidohydrolase family protein [Limnochorda pilosa]|uniref:Amidohydrolase-related domain-containing protein n=1 Tax=Limnochorda pilosa TaxID=1555112 RepID=A0A0K2SMN6_LIMPI|nr:amidohydrolase family protein [Limnochorda pilosa]BAS28370.1 hypothetical protein LIP_2540 [Limnochorda pilosa]